MIFLIALFTQKQHNNAYIVRALAAYTPGECVHKIEHHWYKRIKYIMLVIQRWLAMHKRFQLKSHLMTFITNGEDGEDRYTSGSIKCLLMAGSFV